MSGPQTVLGKETGRLFAGISHAPTLPSDSGSSVRHFEFGGTTSLSALSYVVPPVIQCVVMRLSGAGRAAVRFSETHVYAPGWVMHARRAASMSAPVLPEPCGALPLARNPCQSPVPRRWFRLPGGVPNPFLECRALSAPCESDARVDLSALALSKSQSRRAVTDCCHGLLAEGAGMSRPIQHMVALRLVMTPNNHGIQRAGPGKVRPRSWERR